MAPPNMSFSRAIVSPQQQSTPRDLSQVDTSLTAVNNAHATWSNDVQATDQALAALEAAQATYDAAKTQEASSRSAYEAAQQQYNADYSAVPKEDSLP